MNQFLAIPTPAWSANKHMQTVLEDIAGYGIDVEFADGALLVTIPEKANEYDRREQMVRSRLERHYGWKIKAEA